jgi:hypothetical protein
MNYVYTVEQSELTLQSRTEFIMSIQQVYCIGSAKLVSPFQLITHINTAVRSNFSPLIFRIRQLFETADLSYTLPAHRATVYIVGIALGFVLRYCGRDIRLKKVCLKFEVIRVVTVNIAVSCVVTAYVPMF